MSMNGGTGTKAAVSEINVTPLIDVLLVLLIIFMVIVPVAPKGMDALLPQPPKQHVSDLPDTIVVSVVGKQGEAPSYRINQDSFSKAGVESKLQQIFAIRQEKVMFVKGDPNLNYSTVAEVINMGHEAGVDSIGIITPKIEQAD